MACNLDISKIYIHHYTKLTDRKKYLVDELKDIGIPVVWMDQYDRETIDPELISRWYNPSLIPERIKYLSEPKPFETGAWNIPKTGSTITERCVAISHLLMFKDIAENPTNGNFMSLEDDVIFSIGWKEALTKAMLYAPSDWKILFPGNAFYNIHLFNTPYLSTARLSWHLHKRTRQADMYILNKDTAKEIWQNCQSGCIFAADWELDYHLTKLRLPVYWLEPGVSFQGSETGTYKISITDRGY